MKEYKNIFFDWDGCIYNSLPIWLTACKVGLAQCQIDAPDWDIARHILPKFEAAQDYGVTNLETFIQTVITTANELLCSGQLNPGFLTTLDRLVTHQIEYVIVTSTKSSILETTLTQLQLSLRFPHRITRDDVTHVKPHPEPLLKAMALIEAEATTSIMIGDSYGDIEVGQAVGMDTILYHPPAHEPFYDLNELKQLRPTYIIEHWDELYEILPT